MELPSDYDSGYAAMDREHIGRGRREASLDLSPHHFFHPKDPSTVKRGAVGVLLAGKKWKTIIMTLGLAEAVFRR